MTNRKPLQVGTIYLLQAVGTSRYKIGYATNVEKRIKVLQTASPFPLWCIKAVPGTLKDEALLHSMYRSQRVCGEWFEFRVLTTIWAAMDLLQMNDLACNPSAAQPIVKDSDGTLLDLACDFLVTMLSDGMMPQRDIEKQAKSHGITRGTLRRAKVALRIKSVKTPDAWMWQLRLD